MHKKVIFVVVFLFSLMLWRTCQMPSSRALDKQAQAEQSQKDLAYQKDLNSREWRPYQISIGHGWRDATVQSGLEREISVFNSDLIAVTIDRNPRNRGVNILNPQPGKTIWAPVGAYKAASAAK